MVKHYFFRGEKPPSTEPYNAAAKTRVHDGHRTGSALRSDRLGDLEASAVLLAGMVDGRISLGALVALRRDVGHAGLCFGHLIMVVLHGWNNFVSMLTGWKKDPEY